jgi:formylmethanofuran dehydrogenase subunit E
LPPERSLTRKPVHAMDKTEVLRSIHHDHLIYIQQKVRVDFDNRRQQPVSFHYAGKTYRTDTVICRFRTLPDQPANGYLVQTSDDDVFCLYAQLDKIERRGTLEHGFWVLCFRIQNDDELMSWYREDRKMMVNLSMKRIVNFHGHVCPELAVGGKFCEFAQNLFNNGVIPVSGFSVLAENATSALDAIQVLLGATVGNQRLSVMDIGKHTYTLFSHAENRGWTLKLKPLLFGDEEQFIALQEAIARNEATLEEAVHFQQMIDARVEQILAMSVEDLFIIEESAPGLRSTETAASYRICSACGEQVLSSHCIVRGTGIFCQPCFQAMISGSTDNCVH